MNSNFVRLFLCAILLLGTSTAFAQGQKVTRENREANENERDSPQERAKWFLRGRTVDGRPAPELLHKAYQQKLNNRRLRDAARAEARATTQSSSTATTQTVPSVEPNFIQATGGPSWIPLGPAPSGTASIGELDQDYGPAIGRTTVVVVDQSDATGNTVYIGGASGGLWKSTNAASTTVQNCGVVSVSQAPYCATAVTWTPLLDQQATLTVGALAIKPDNHNWLVVGSGEANNSADSYYGLGFLVSPDAGSTWTLISTAKSADGSSTIDLHGLGTSHLAFSTETIVAQNLTTSTVVATMAAASGGLSVGAEFASVGNNTPRGIYFSHDAGLTWQRARVCDSQSWTPPNCPAGSTPDSGSANAVLYNPFTHLFYANIRYHGFYSSPDGQNWTRLAAQPGGSLLGLAACPSTPFSTGCPLYRAEMTVVPGRAGANNKGEMYVWMVNSSDVNQGIFQTVNGGATWTPLSTTGIDSCGDGGGGACGTTQGSYNLSLLAVPNGLTATDLYAAAVNQYRCNLDPFLNPTCAAKPFHNLTHTYGSCGAGTTGAFSHVHPDQHAIDFVQAKPQLLFFGNDGGVYRTLNGFDIATQTCNGAAQPWIQFDNLSGTMGSMLQFVWFSQSPSDANVLLGGTQDNGTMAKNASSTATVLGNSAPSGFSWQSVNNGDGGFNDINPVSPQEWFVSNPRVSVQQCFNGSGITCTANTFSSSEIVNSSKVGGDSGPFYVAYMLDPQATTHLLVGTCRLWRIDRAGNLATTWPGSTPLTYNLDQFNAAGASQCSSSASNMITAIAAGGPCKGVCNSGPNGAGNGSQVIYAGTNAGRVFVTTNADGGASTWADRTNGLPTTLSCTNAPCPISGIAIDPADPSGNTAYVTVMGFKVGHVAKTTNAGVTWTSIDGAAGGTGLPDNPADAIAVDPNQAGLIYVATDVGVFKSLGDGNWTEVGPSAGTGALPNVAATALRIFGTGAGTHLRVSTYGRGIWEIPIPNVPGFQFVVSPLTATTNIQQSATVNGTITPFNGYNSTVNLQCNNVPAGVTCTPSITSVNTASGAVSFTVNLSATAAGVYNFNITAVGTDSAAITQQQAITLNAVIPAGLLLSTPPQARATTGLDATTNFNLTSANGFSGAVTLQCFGLPSTATCVFSPNTTLVAGGTNNITLTIHTGSTPASSTPYAFTINASSPNSLTATVGTSLLVTVPPDFTMDTPAAVTPSPVSAGLTASTSFVVTANSTFTGTLTFSCTGLPAGAGPCVFTPVNVNLSPDKAVTVNVLIATGASVTPGTYPLTVTSAGSITHSGSTALVIGAPSNTFELTTQIPLNPIATKPGLLPLPVTTLTARSSQYAGTVTFSCVILPASASGNPPCTFSPPSVVLSAGTSQPVIVTVNTAGVPAGPASVTVTARDASGISASSTALAYTVTDYSVSVGTATPIFPGGSLSVPVTLSPQFGYSGTIIVTCNAPLPLNCAPATTTLGVGGSGPGTVNVTITGPGSSITTAGGTYAVAIQTTDVPLVHSASIPVTVQDYKLQSSAAAATITAGQSSTFTLTVAPQPGGFSGSVILDAAAACSGLPSKTTCTVNGLSTGTVTVPSGGTATLVIQTTAATTAGLRHWNAPLFALWTVLPGAFGIVFIARKRKSAMWTLLVFVLLVLLVMTGCGGGGGGTTTTPPPLPVPGTPAGVYSVIVNSTSGSGSSAIARSTTITLTVQ